MPPFANLPNFGGTIDAYGIDAVPMPLQANLLPGGGNVGAGFPSAWIIPGQGAPLPWETPRIREVGVSGLGLRGMADYVPGGIVVRRGFSGLGDGSNTNSNAANAAATASNVSTQSSSQQQTSNITIQPNAGGAFSSEGMPVALGLGGLGLFGALLWMASKQKAA